MKFAVFFAFFAFLIPATVTAQFQDNWTGLGGGGTANTGHDFTFHPSTSSHTNSSNSQPANQGGATAPSQPAAAPQEDFEAEFQALYLAADSRQTMQAWWDFAKRSGNPAAWFNYAAMASRLDDYDTAYKTYDWLTTHCGTVTKICEMSKERAKDALNAMVAALNATLATSRCIMANTYRFNFEQAQQEQKRLWGQKYDLDLKFAALTEQTTQLHQKTTAYNKQKMEWEMDPSSAGRASLQESWNELAALQKAVTDGTVKWAGDSNLLRGQINENSRILDNAAKNLNGSVSGGACTQ